MTDFRIAPVFRPQGRMSQLAGGPEACAPKMQAARPRRHSAERYARSSIISGNGRSSWPTKPPDDCGIRRGQVPKPLRAVVVQGVFAGIFAEMVQPGPDGVSIKINLPHPREQRAAASPATGGAQQNRTAPWPRLLLRAARGHDAGRVRETPEDRKIATRIPALPGAQGKAPPNTTTHSTGKDTVSRPSSPAPGTGALSPLATTDAAPCSAPRSAWPRPSGSGCGA